VRGIERPIVFFGTLHTHAGGWGQGQQWGDDLISSLHVMRLGGSGSPPDHDLLEDPAIILDGTQGHPKLFGLCGIAVGDLFEDQDGVDAELVLTTLAGDLVIYDLDPVGTDGVAVVTPPLHHEICDGALGAYNSILIDDTEPDRVLWVAGSMGMRKFVVPH
jgi:hypothetical protein